MNEGSMSADKIIDILKDCQPATGGMLYLPTSEGWRRW